MEKTFSIIITGLVQGVGFRYYIKEKADQLGVTGLVKNLTNGNLYMECCGKQAILKKFVEACQRGPALAQVATCRVSEIASKNFSDFKIEY